MSAIKKLDRARTSRLDGVNRILLQCRFDYRERSWGFPATNLASDRPEQTDALLAALAAAQRQFTGSTPGHYNPI